MNRLFYNRVYLSGPIDNAADFGVGWRLDIRHQLADLDLIFLDPCDKPMLAGYGCEDLESHQRRVDQKARGDFEALAEDVHLIRCLDLRLADLCDFAIVHLDRTIYSTGTHEEIALLNRRKVPILVHVEQGKIALPDWYWGALPHQHIFGTWKELMNHVRMVAYSPDPVETYNRWRFLDYGTLYGKRTIPLSNNGRAAIVSPEDHDYLAQWRWRRCVPPSGPKQARIKRPLHGDGGSGHRCMHQEVLHHMGAPDNLHVTFRDDDPLNNTRENLRVSE